MATLSGVNYAKSVAQPLQLISQGEFSGEVKLFYEEITPSIALASADLIKIGPKLPAGCRIVGGFIKSAAQGGTCTIDLGNEVGALGNEAAAVASLGAAFSLVAASSQTLASKSGAKFGEKFSEPVQLVALVNANGANASAKLQICIQYVVA